MAGGGGVRGSGALHIPEVSGIWSPALPWLGVGVDSGVSGEDHDPWRGSRDSAEGPVLVFCRPFQLVSRGF